MWECAYHAVGWPKNPLAEEEPPTYFNKAAKIVTSTTYLVQKLTGESVVDHYSAANFSPLYEIGKAGAQHSEQN